jgi:hypothetical protein
VDISNEALDAFQVPRHAIEPSRERGLQPIGAVGRQMRSERRLDDKRLRHALASRIIGQLSSEIGRKAKGVLGTHGLHICMSSPGSSETWRATVPKVRCMMRWRCASSSGSGSGRGRLRKRRESAEIFVY